MPAEKGKPPPSLDQSSRESSMAQARKILTTRRNCCCNYPVAEQSLATVPGRPTDHYHRTILRMTSTGTRKKRRGTGMGARGLRGWYKTSFSREPSPPGVHLLTCYLAPGHRAGTNRSSAADVAYLKATEFLKPL